MVITYVVRGVPCLVPGRLERQIVAVSLNDDRYVSDKTDRGRRLVSVHDDDDEDEDEERWTMWKAAQCSSSSGGGDDGSSSSSNNSRSNSNEYGSVGGCN